MGALARDEEPAVGALEAAVAGGRPRQQLGDERLPAVRVHGLEALGLVARFRHDLDRRKLQIKPLSIVTDSSVVRLTL